MTYQPNKEEMAALLRMVETQAAKVLPKARDVRRDDLIAEGQYALVMALRRYKEGGEASAWTFCQKRVKGAMLDLVTKQRRPQMGKRNTGPAYTFESVDEEFEDDAPDAVSAIALADVLDVLTPSERAIADDLLAGESISSIARKTGDTRAFIRQAWAEAMAKMQQKVGSRTDI